MHAHRASCGWFAVAIAALCVATATSAICADVTVRDASGRSVVVRDASRIVSVGGAVTEILYALGLDSRVIAVDSTSLYPPRALAEKPNVGYMRQLSAEGVLGLGPSLCSPLTARAPRRRSRCWKPPRFRSCGCPTTSPARASSRRSA
jgi:heme transport system substrate-binding protein